MNWQLLLDLATHIVQAAPHLIEELNTLLKGAHQTDPAPPEIQAQMPSEVDLTKTC